VFDPPIDYRYNTEDSTLWLTVSMGNYMIFTYNINPYVTAGLVAVKDKLRLSLEFDLAHAFGHTSMDPNYTLLHWALWGVFQNRWRGYIKLSPP